MLAQIELRLTRDCLFAANARGLAWQQRGLPELGGLIVLLSRRFDKYEAEKQPSLCIGNCEVWLRTQICYL